MSSEDEIHKTCADILVEFFEVAFHSILYSRQIYPRTIFTAKKKYNIAVHISIHPKVNEYITECLTTIKELVQWNCVKEVHLTVQSPAGDVLERHIFYLSLTDATTRDPYLVRVEETFRAYLLKLSVSEAYLDPLPDNSLFEIEIKTTQQSAVRFNELVNQFHFPWLEKDVTTDQAINKRVTPLKSLNTAELKMDMYIEHCNISLF